MSGSIKYYGMGEQLKMTPLDILIVGGGMYVTGRGAPDYQGTILPAVLEARRAGLVGRIAITTTRLESAEIARSKAVELADKMGVGKDIEVFPKSGNNIEIYNAETLPVKAAKIFEPDAVIVSIPDHLHAQVCIPLIQSGKHCLVVKPMAAKMEDAKAMADAARKAGVVAEVEFHKRLDQSNLLFREAVCNGDLGHLLYATIEYSQRKSVPRDTLRSWAENSNIFQYLGVHYVDLLSWATGFKPHRVTTWGQKSYLRSNGVDTWDAMQTVIEWRQPNDTSFISTHISNWIDPDNNSALSDQKINVVGTLGRFQADQKNRGVQTVRDKNGVRDLNPYFTTEWIDDLTGNSTFQGYGVDSVIQFIRDITAFRNGIVSLSDLDRVRPSFQNCLISTAVIDASNASLRASNAPIEVKL
tara:strand:- start:3765 stop:5006 length:1242 start_codon:yes stop_codon:yes gene_type:complete